jgi:small nuclear ribonucleoprotein (snRNP)-like protein
MLFFSFFKTLVDHEVTVELKNDIQIKGVLKSVDQFLNIKLENIQVLEEVKYPHLVSFRPQRDGIYRGTRNQARNEAMANILSVVCGQECIHQRECGEVCPLARRGGGYHLIRGRNEER